MAFPFVLGIDGVSCVESDLAFNVDISRCSIDKESGPTLLVLSGLATCRVEESASVDGNELVTVASFARNSDPLLETSSCVRVLGDDGCVVRTSGLFAILTSFTHWGIMVLDLA